MREESNGAMMEDGHTGKTARHPLVLSWRRHCHGRYYSPCTLFLLLLGVGFVPTGCNLAPAYTRPAAPVPAEWPRGPAYPDTQAGTDAALATDLGWQEFFADERLQQLIATALQNNRDLRLATLSVQRARALYGIQRAQLLPAVSAAAGASRQRIPADLSGVGEALTVEQYSASLGVLAWELDFFGRLGNLTARALEEYLATEQGRRSAQILLVSSVANAALVLAADREALALAQTTLITQQGVYDLIQRRFDRGAAPELDLYRAQTQVDAARGDVARFTQLVAQDENALSLLLGVPAPAQLVPPRLSDVRGPREISPGMSSAVLLRRPDVLEAESLLRAAHADIGAARAAFFPRISLTAVLGTASDELGRLFGSGSGTWNYGAAAALPLFDARLWSGLEATRVQREFAVAQYERAIQNAFREVADALAAVGTVGRQVAAQEALVHAMAETYRLSRARYDKGIDSYLSVLDAQRSLYAAQQGLVSLYLAQLVHQVTLYRVLGGGSDATPAPAGP